MRWPLFAAVGILAGCSNGGYLEDLRHDSPEKRVAAADFLGAQRDQEAVTALIGVLSDQDPRVRAKGAWALGMIRSREAVMPLLPLLKDSDRAVKQAVIGALMNLEEPEALPALRAALSVELDTWVAGDLEEAITYLMQFEGDDDVGEFSFR